jgi:tetratricopeptide (TPR) repeat protein
MSRFENLEFDDPAHAAHAEEAFADEARWLQEADVALRAGEFEQALRLFSRVAEGSPGLATAWAGQVRMLIELGELKEANVWADKALERFPRDPEVLAAKAVAVGRLGDGKAALAFSDAALAEAGESPYVWLARGDVLLARGERRAEYCFARALARSAHDWLWPWLASRIHYFHRKLSLALKFVRQALSLDAAQPVIWWQLGRCQMALGLTAEAEDSYMQARQLAPTGATWSEFQEPADAPSAWCRWWMRLRRRLEGEP